MPKPPQTTVFGLTIRQIINAGDGAVCSTQKCMADLADWVVYQEHYDGQDDPSWYACDAHLSQVAVDAIDYQDDDE